MNVKRDETREEERTFLFFMFFNVKFYGARKLDGIKRSGYSLHNPW